MPLLFLVFILLSAFPVVAAKKPQNPLLDRHHPQFDRHHPQFENLNHGGKSKDSEGHHYTLHEFKDYRGKLQVSFSSTGEGIFSGPITSRGGESQLPLLAVSGNLTVGKNLQVLSEANVRIISVSNQLATTDRSTVDFHGKVNFLANTRNVKDVHFDNGWKSSGDVKVDGNVDATSMQLKEHLVVGTIEVKNGIQAAQLVVKDSIKAGTIRAEAALEVKGPASSQSLFVISSISTKDLQVNGTASVASLAVKSASIEKDMKVDGTITAVKWLRSHGDCNVDGILQAKDAKIAGSLVAPELRASDVYVSQNLSVKGNAVIENSARIKGSLEASEKIKAPMVEAATAMSAPFMNVSDTIQSKRAQISQLNVDQQATFAGNMFVSNNSSISVTGNMRVDQNVSIGSSLSVKQSIDAATLSISDAVNTTMLYASTISASSLEVVGTDAPSLQSVNGYESSHGGIEVAKNIISHGHIAAKLGVTTSNLTAYGVVTLDGDETHITSLSAGDILVDARSDTDGNTSVGNIRVRNGGNVTVESPGIVHAKGGLVVESGTQSYLNGDVVASGQFQFKDSVKVDGGVTSNSVFTSRIYTEDVSARGFVSASTLVSTGDVDVSGSVAVHRNVKVEDTMEANNIVSLSSISCKTATIDGVVTAAGLTVQKVRVSGELLVQDVNVLELLQMETKLLKDRIDELERRLALK